MAEDGYSRKDALNELRRIANLLSDPRAYMIFDMSLTGLSGDSKTYKTVGLSKKQYYSRLNRLVKAGLIVKVRGIYKQTMRGGTAYNIIREIIDTKSTRLVLLNNDAKKLTPERFTQKLVESRAYSDIEEALEEERKDDQDAYLKET